MDTTGTIYKNYIFRTVVYPIHGVDEDLSVFLRKFEGLGSIRFTQFAWLWRKEKFIHIIYNRQNQLGLCDILGCLFHRLIDLLLPGSKSSHLRRICALYLLYAFHGKQPMRNQVRIRVCPLSWPAVHQLACEARDDGHLDVYYVFKQLCVANAFAFCATRQALYPGAPLFDSPRYKYDASSAPRGRRNVVASYLPLIKPPNSCFSDQSEALECLDTSLKQYTDSKRLLNQLKPPSKDTAATEPVEYDERDEFLPGLNFITYPASLNKLSNIVNELTTQQQLFKEQAAIDRDSSDSDDSYTSLDGVACSTNDISTELHRKTEDSKRLRPGEKPLSSAQHDSISGHNTSVVPSTSATESTQLGERRKLLRQPVTWSSELADQAKEVRAHGCRRSRRRPAEPKCISPFKRPTSPTKKAP